MAAWSFTDSPSVPSRAPRGLSCREQRLRQVGVKEFSLKSADQTHEYERRGSPREAQPGRSRRTDCIATRTASPEPCAPWPPRPPVLQGDRPPQSQDNPARPPPCHRLAAPKAHLLWARSFRWQLSAQGLPRWGLPWGLQESCGFQNLPETASAQEVLKPGALPHSVIPGELCEDQMLMSWGQAGS